MTWDTLARIMNGVEKSVRHARVTALMGIASVVWITGLVGCGGRTELLRLDRGGTSSSTVDGPDSGLDGSNGSTGGSGGMSGGADAAGGAGGMTSGGQTGAGMGGTTIPMDAGRGSGGIDARAGGSSGGAGYDGGVDRGSTGGTGGRLNTGGAGGSGGISAKGGTVGSGGVLAKGGTVGSGGVSAKGGTAGSGGVSAKSGTIGSGGVSAKGGAGGTGGTTAVGGTTAAGGTIAGPDAGGPDAPPDTCSATIPCPSYANCRGQPTCNTTTGLCSAPTQCSVCGNGILEFSEQCDDGNTMSGDHCSSTCKTEFCGDGIVQSKALASLSLTTLARSCGLAVPQDIWLVLNGKEVARGVVRQTCDCEPGLITLPVTNPSFLALGKNGPNVIEVHTPAEISWAVVHYDSPSGGGDIFLVDYGSNGAAQFRRPNLCTNGTYQGREVGTTIDLAGAEACDNGNRNGVGSDPCSSTCMSRS